MYIPACVVRRSVEANKQAVATTVDKYVVAVAAFSCFVLFFFGLLVGFVPAAPPPPERDDDDALALQLFFILFFPPCFCFCSSLFFLLYRPPVKCRADLHLIFRIEMLCKDPMVTCSTRGYYR